ncbi:SusC/RagA family TonB-linked outer membrane protein [Puteibacter caeruleilacunae]|nr:SusC/RagA family TonB-linked outer membrane protein [Puteibacter caeruleilacunae]
MKKFQFVPMRLSRAGTRKIFLCMRLTVFLLLLNVFCVMGNSYSQQVHFNMKYKGVAIKTILKEIQSQSEFEFFYNDDDFDVSKKIDLNVKNKQVEVILDQILKDSSLGYRIVDNIVVITNNPSEAKSVQQEQKVKGIVKDANGEAIPGVSVVVKGTTIGVTTDLDGNYELKVPAGSQVLEFSFVGMAKQEIPYTGQATLNVVMQDEAIGVDEVVVTALGIKREKKALGYAVTEVSSEEITQSNERNVANALTGKVAGLEITKPSGSSMGSSKIVLRGNSSITGNNEALIVVDGVIFNNGSSIGGSRATAYDRGQGISDINPEDIASVTVLKGANASALYGSRAANGVIVITTKTKTKDKGIGLTLKTGFSLKQAYVWPELQNVYGQGKVFNSWTGVGDDGIPMIGGSTNDESWGPKMEGQDVRVLWLRDEPIRKYSPQPDNIKEPFRTSLSTDNALSVSYGTEKATYYASLMHQDINEYIVNSGGSKIGGSLRVTQDITDRLKLDMKLSYSEQKAKNRMVVDTGGISFMRIAAGPRSYYDSDLRRIEYEESNQDWATNFKDGDPVAFSTTKYTGNIYWGLMKDTNKDTRRRLVGNINLTYKIIDNLSIMLRHGFDQLDFEAHTVKALQSRWGNYDGRYIYQEDYSRSYTTDFLMNWNKQLTENISLTANFGGSQFRSKSKGGTFNGTGFPNSEMQQINYTTSSSFKYGESDKVINSLYGSTQFGYKSLFYLDLTYRNDWSSTLKDGNNSYGYYSTTGSFVFTEAVEDLPSWLTFGKVRYSYAEVGNDTSPYKINRTYSTSTGVNGEITMSNPSTMPFFDMKPERVESHEFGVDVRTFNGRLNIDATYYKSNTKDQIIPSQPIAHSSGFTARSLNGGNVENKGLELMINARPVETKDFAWNTTVTYTKNKSKVVSTPDDLVIVPRSDKRGRVVTQPGSTFLTVQGYGYLRNDEGKIVVDQDGLPLRTDEFIDLGKVEPDWVGSLRNTFTYKNITLGCQVDGSFGGNIWSKCIIDFDEQGTSVASLAGREEWIASEEARIAAGVSPGDWTPTGGVDEMIGQSVFYDENLVGADGVQVGGVLNEGENKRYAHPEDYRDNMYSRRLTEYAMEDASFVKLRELSLSYSLPKKLSQKLHFENIDLSVVGRDLFILYRETEHYDPDSYVTNTSGNGSKGMAMSFWPSYRTMSFNIKFKF